MHPDSMKKLSIISAVIWIIMSTSIAFAQQKTASPDTLAATINKLSKTVQVLEKIKISGYIQAQFQVADTLGTKTFEGGDFAKSSSKRFMVRRGYFKVAYAGGLSTYVLQINVNEKGFSVRDAYFNLKEPWLNAFSLTGGIFMRPFGCELLYPTNQRETPELARITQTLFPGERDLGASLTFQMPEKSTWHPFKIEAGLFTGNGTSAETDDKLDFIGRIGYSDACANNKISYGIGTSFYNGSVYQAKKQVYEIDSFKDTLAFRQILSDTIPGKYQKRQYIGFDGQFAFKTRLGTTTLRADYMFGTQPASDTSSISPSEKIGAPLYNRKFQGAVVYLIHNFPNSIHSVVFKFDYYDPNTKLSGDQIGLKPRDAKVYTNSTDIAYSTIGFGYFADVNKRLRLTLYFDLVKNETSKNLSKFGGDLKDNVFTARVQYRF
jgi:hypothetical protein